MIKLALLIKDVGACKHGSGQQFHGLIMLSQSDHQRAISRRKKKTTAQ